MGDAFAYKNLAASGLVKTGPGALHAIVLTAGSDAATAVVYDNAAGSGDVILSLGAPVADKTVAAVLDAVFSTGCYVVLTGTDPSCTVSYR
jgi:hypothetical protein